MKKIDRNTLYELKDFLILWSTQSLSGLGSAITAFALTLWLYEKTGSALSTALLTVCSYVPYVLTSIFAGALTDRLDKKRTMLVCDALAALSTVTVLILLETDALRIWHLYVINAVNGLMNTVQQPAGEIAMTLLVPKKHYQRVSALRSFSNSLVTILNPLIATALYALAGMRLVIAVDLGSFAIAFVALCAWIRIPAVPASGRANVIGMAKEGLAYLRRTPLVLSLILFLAGVNLAASAFDAVLPGYVIPNPRGGSAMLGLVSSFAGIAMLVGSLAAGLLPKPANRVRVIYLTMLFSLGTENFLLAFSRQPAMWCLSQVIGWIPVPVMSANLDVVLRSTIPVELQGRVYACRNSLQFFTIPLGLFLGGAMVDQWCEPFMAARSADGYWTALFGAGKGSGAALAMFVLGVVGVAICLVAGRILRKYRFKED